jgi:tetratricopeptide (TPR) repeat protein
MSRTAAAGLQRPVRTGELPAALAWRSFGFQAALLLVITGALYLNSIGNRYAFDDGPMVQQNEYVQRGLRGIPSILSTDSFSSLYHQLGGSQELSAGRYRPLSLVTFAVEHQIFGADPHAEHAVNVLLYLLLVYFLFRLLRTLLPQAGDLAFLTVFLFAIHPAHTEVVANIKSRDEILSLLFLVLTLISLLRWAGRERGRRTDLALALGFYFLALLSKEYGLAFLVLIPMLLVLFRGMSVRRSLGRTLPFLGVAALYVVIRLKVVGFGTVENTDILNNPYLHATGAEKWATRLYILLRYLLLLLRPYPLSSDYSYNQIPYRNFSDPGVWISVLLYLGIIAAGVVLWRRRHWLAFALAFYLLNLLMVSNLLVDIGATMGERLVFHASLGFTLAAAFAVLKGFQALRGGAGSRLAYHGLLLALLVLCAAVVIPRNAQWKDDTTLFLHDVKVVPNSVLANGNAGRACVVLADEEKDESRKNALLSTALIHLRKAVELDPGCVNAWFYLGNAYDRLGDYDRMEAMWNEARARFPQHPNFRTYDPVLANRFGSQGVRRAQAGDYRRGAELLEKALHYAPGDAWLWYRYGRVLLLLPDREKADRAFRRALELDPGMTEARQALEDRPVPDRH